MADESARARMIEDLSNLLREVPVPEATRSAGLHLIGFLARRMPGEAPHRLGVAEARDQLQSECRIRVDDKKLARRAR